MFIEVVRVGGVAGLTRRAQIDTDAIDDKDSAREWRELVDQARPLLLSHLDTPPPPASARDAFVWTVSVDDTTCHVDDSSVTGALRDLAQRTLKEGRRPREHSPSRIVQPVRDQPRTVGDDRNR